MKSRKKDGTDTKDHISNLPDDVIGNILSRLPTKYAVQTCVLSKAWEYKWTSVYDIDVYGQGSHTLAFVEFMDSVLFNVQNVRGFSFISHGYFPEECSRMKTWLSTLFRRNVEKVMIESSINGVVLPRSLSTCFSLRELDIDMSCTWKTPIYSYFPNLTRLSLSLVEIKNENSNSDTLVFHFPVLKTFEISLHEWLNVRFVELYAPALISFLSVNMDGEEIDSYIIKIIGASLQNFETGGYNLENFLFTGSTVSHTALKNYGYIDKSGDVDDSVVKSGLRIRRLLKETSSLKSLDLTYYLAQALAATKSGLSLSRFAKLERLSLSSGDEGCAYCEIEEIFEGLFELLRSAPVLNSLIIEGFSKLKIDSQDDHNFDMMEPVPSCVVSHLEDVKIDGSSGEMHELNLAKYFLENGAKLKTLSLSLYGGINKNEVRKQLSESPNASTSLKIVVTQENT